MDNVLILYADQCRLDVLGAYGNKLIATPNIDRLAKRGLTFTQCTTPSPVCMPARWSLHAGQWTTTHRCWSNHHIGITPPTNLPRELANVGYRTGLIGKNHSFLSADDCEVFEDAISARHTEEQQESLTKLKNRCPRLQRSSQHAGIETEDDHQRVHRGLEFIDDSANEKRPFFLWLSLLHPHTPYYVADPYFHRYADCDPMGPAQLEAEGLEAAGKPFRHIFHRDNTNAHLPFSVEDVAHMRRVYAGQVTYLDYEIGRVLDHLDELDLTSSTQIWFLSDHGDYMGDHGLITKSPSLYDCLVRTPLIVAGPGIQVISAAMH